MSSVRGPNSALTEFLRSQGINASEIRDRWERRQRGDDPRNYDGSENAPEAVATANGEADPEVEAIALAAARKARGDADDFEQEGTTKCVYCSSRFTITVYSKQVGDGYVCLSCAAQSKPAKQKKTATAAARKKRKKTAASLLEQHNRTVPSLQDLCISCVADYIDDVDELGDLSSQNFIKISAILSRNRKLTARTCQLFFRPEATTLELWDCSELPCESFNLIPALCPNLKRLVLGMCGQLNGENLRRIAELKSLEEVVLDGAFLVRKEAWIEFFETAGPRLKKLTIKSVYRIDVEVLAMLVEMCSSLESLTLVRISQLCDSTPFYLLGNLAQLRHLELIELEPEALDDSCMLNTLNMIGAQLESLSISNANLTDSFINTVAATCGSLTSLELVNLPAVTEEAVASMFENWSERSTPGLQTLSLQRCIALGDGAIAAVLKHSRTTLVDLNVNSLRLLTGESINAFASLPNLTKLDIGFVGSVEPQHIYKLSTSKSLRLVLAYGNIRLSDMPLPTNLTVVGTM